MKFLHKNNVKEWLQSYKLWFFLALGVLVFAIGCKHDIQDRKEEKKKIHTISFNSKNENFGVLKAKFKEGNEISSPYEVEDGSVVVFTAEPKPSFEVVFWHGATPSSQNALNLELEIHQDVDISVEFFLKDFVKIKPPENGINGKEATYQLAGKEGFWKGVFLKDRLVKLDEYSISKYALTYSLWKEVYDWATSGEGKEKGYEFAFGELGRKGSNNEGSEKQPVTMISWYDAIIWCNAYTEKVLGTSFCVYRATDEDISIIRKASKFSENTLTIPQMKKNIKLKGFRLPSEAEWEFACRYQGDDSENAEDYGGFYLTRLNSASGAKKPNGFKGMTLPENETWETLKDEANRLSIYSMYWNGEKYAFLDPKTKGTSEVGTKEPNHLGLFDMSGNVLEWCFDWYNENAIRSDDQYEVDGKVVNPLGSVDGFNRVRCGGSFGGTSHTLSCGYRVFFKPDARLKFDGMRLVVSF